jgi:hypothetical protein
VEVGQVLERAVLKAADLFRVEGLLEHCMEAFGRGLKVDTAVEQLVWAHNHGPAEARTVATGFFVRNGLRIQVGVMCDIVCVWFGMSSSLVSRFWLKKRQAGVHFFEGETKSLSE